MSSREQCEKLLETIDAVLSECGKDPRQRRGPRPPARPAWPGPTWARDAQLPDGSGLRSRPDQRTS